MADIRMGIIGFGFMGHEHANMLKEQGIEGITLTAVCDTNPAQLKDAPAGVKTYPDMDTLLADPEITTVIIAIPNRFHAEAVRKACEHGKDIICEKPCAMSVPEFDEMMKEVKAAGVRFTVHQQRRFDPDFRTMKNVYDGGMVGKVYTVQSMLYGINGNMHDWHVFVSEGGGMLYDWGVHLLDQLLYMIKSPVKTVYADVRNVINKEVDDYFKIELYFENGVVAEVELGTYFLEDRPKWFERHWIVGGDSGTAYSDGFDPEGKIAHTTRLLTNVPGKITMSASGPTRSFGPPAPGVLTTEDLPKADTKHRMYFENYVRATDGLEEFLVKPEEVRRVLCLMDAVRESGRTHRTVDFE
ncbi:MAG: Gfo/Idh/MocA family oxidoreductase [Lachnospiraceae bacterium]|jgi:scyllo-inositol 2-dehydrogenase (NADP+)|nr:Gfo/Idh/MocA family oxidoreductase [Lachnospiraceae bacterium]